MKRQLSNSPVYFLDPLSDQILSIVRVLNESGYERPMVAVSGKNKVAHSMYKRLGYSSVVDESDIDYNECYGQLVPGRALSTERLLRQGPITLGSVIMDPVVLEVYDKDAFIAHCHRHGLPVPKGYDGLRSIASEDFPIFYKERYESGGGVRGIAHSLKEIPMASVDSLMFQEYIDSPGTYGVGFIAERGRMLTMCCHHEVSSYPGSGGSAIIIERYHNKRLIDLTKRIVDSLDYSGWGLAEFKFCPRRRDFVFMEINAKFWASIELALRTQPEFLTYLFGVRTTVQETEGLFFLNRAAKLGPVSAISMLWGARSYRLIVYPRLVRSVVIGLVPSFLAARINAMSTWRRSSRQIMWWRKVGRRSGASAGTRK